jgi:hypothetical protein
MLSSRIAAAAFGALAVTIGAFSAAPASAAPISTGVVQTAPAGDLVQQAQYYGPRRHYRPYRHHYRRPIHRPRCFMTNRRVWTGYGWVVRPVRVCR